MSANNYQNILASAVEKFNQGDLEGYLDTMYAPNVTLHFLPPGLPPGIEGGRLFYGGFLAGFPGATLIIDDSFVEGDRLVARFHIDMTHTGEFNGIPATGKQVSFSGITIMRFENDKVVERWSESDFIGLMQQLGAIPMPGQ